MAVVPIPALAPLEGPCPRNRQPPTLGFLWEPSEEIGVAPRPHNAPELGLGLSPSVAP